MPERLHVYIDGFNLYHGLHDKWGCKRLWLDVVSLSEALRPLSEVQLVRYFTAPVLGDAGAASRQSNYQGALKALHGERLEIVQGRYQSKPLECRKCGHAYIKHEEKETDVNIAVSLVSDAARNAMDAALIISADSDMAPAVRAARALQPGLFIAAAFPPKRNSGELKRLMPNSFHIGPGRISAAQMASEVTSEVGTSFRRPHKWNP